LISTGNAATPYQHQYHHHRHPHPISVSAELTPSSISPATPEDDPHLLPIPRSPQNQYKAEPGSGPIYSPVHLAARPPDRSIPTVTRTLTRVDVLNLSLPLLIPIQVDQEHDHHLIILPLQLDTKGLDLGSII
jgi:hypothetical protein